MHTKEKMRTFSTDFNQMRERKEIQTEGERGRKGDKESYKCK